MQSRTIKTKTEKEITLTIFNSPNNESTLIIVPATGVKQSFYQKFAQYIAQQGLTVITFDYYGIGRSLHSSIKKIKTTAEEWGNDNLESVIQFAITNSPNGSVYLMGHSIGGQLIGLSPSASLAKRVVLISAQSGYWKFWSGFDQFKLWSYWNILFPVLSKVFGYLPSRSFSKMENLPKGVAMQWSEWCSSPNYLFDCVPPHSLHFNSITSELISYSMDDDDLAPKDSVDWLTNAYKNAKVKRLHLRSSDIGVSKLGHFGFFNIQNKEALWQDLLDNVFNRRA